MQEGILFSRLWVKDWEHTACWAGDYGVGEGSGFHGGKGLVSAWWPVFPGDGDWGRIQPQSTAVPLLKTPATQMERRYWFENQGVYPASDIMLVFAGMTKSIRFTETQASHQFMCCYLQICPGKIIFKKSLEHSEACKLLKCYHFC